MSKVILMIAVTVATVIFPAFSNISSKTNHNSLDFMSSDNGDLLAVINRFYDKEQSLPQMDVLKMGLNGLSCLKATNSILHDSLITIIDFRLPSTKKRLWVLNLKSGETLIHSLVAHGKNSGELFAENFSNVPESYNSSLGFYRTGEKYQGAHGLSMYLDGLEEGINHLARERAIVVHAAEYATEDFIKENGRLGRSFGCPSVPPEINEEIIGAIAGGTCLFIYGNDSDYLKGSQFFN